MQQAKAPENECYVDTQSAARLMGVTPRAIRKSIGRSKLSSAKVTGQGGAGGIAHLIPISELPMEAQLRHHQQAEGVNAQSADLAAYRERYGEAGLEKVMARLRAVQEMQLLRGDKRSAQRRAEIAEAMGVKPRCIYDWERKYEAEGLEGLMDKTMRSDKGKSRTLCLLAQDRINYSYLTNGRPSQNWVYMRLRELCDRLGPAICEECCHNPESCNRADMLARGADPGEACRCAGSGMVIPSHHSSINRYVKTLDPAVVTLGRYGNKRFDDLYIPKVRRERPEQVNEVWFGDHHVFDLFVLDSKGVARRPWLTAWMDACSGCFVGWLLSFSPNSKTIGESLALAIAKTGSPFEGPPMWLYIDNGKDYRSRMIEGTGEQAYQPGKLNSEITADNALLKCLGIGVHHALPWRARSKTIERAFGLMEEWIKEMPGYCGNKIGTKPEKLMEDLRRKRLITFEEFAAYFANSLLPEYHAYRGPEGREASPLEMYESHSKARTETVGWPTLSIAMSEKCERVVRPDGIYISHMRYWDEAMAGIVGARVQVVMFQHIKGYITVMKDNAYICTAKTAEQYKLLGEDEEKIAQLTAMQARTRKEKMAALRLPVERVRMIDDMAMEIPDMAQGATITSLVHERAYRGAQEAMAKEERKAETKQKVSSAIRERQEMAGLAFFRQPDAD